MCLYEWSVSPRRKSCKNGSNHSHVAFEKADDPLPRDRVPHEARKTKSHFVCLDNTGANLVNSRNELEHRLGRVTSELRVTTVQKLS